MDTNSAPGQKQAEVHAALRRLADSAKTVVWMADASGTVIYLNQSASELLQAAPAFSRSMWIRLIHPDDQPRAVEVFRKAKETGDEYQVEYRIVRSDGSIRWMMSSGAPRFSGDGAFLGYIGTIIDVSERYEVLERLAQSEAAHRLLTENSSDLISHHAPDTGNYLYVSPSFRRVLGYEPSELVGTVSVYNQVHPDDVKLIRDEIRRQVEAEGGTDADSRLIEFRVRHKDGHYVWMGSNVKLLVNSLTREKIGSVAVSRDITVERLAKEELKRREERFRSLTNLSSDWYWETDEHDRFTFMSEGRSKPSGLPVEEIVGKTRRELAVDPDQPEMLMYLAKIAAREPFKDIRYATVSLVPGTARYASISGEPVYENGVFRGYRGVGRDITAEVETAAELQGSRDQLSSMLESIGDAFYSIDWDWRITYANRKAAEFVGLPLERAIGRILWDVVPDFRSSPLYTHFQQVMATRENSIIDIYWEPARAWLEVRVHPHERGLSIYFHDITSKQAAERAVRESEQRLREIIEMTPAGYALVDAQGRIVDVNPALCSISGYGKAELVGQHMGMLFPVWERDSALFMQGGSTSDNGTEIVIRHKEGHHVFALANISIKRDAQGNGLSLTVFLADITERKMVEARLEQLATHDTLTGLPNRTLLNDRLQQMLDAAPRNQSIAVMFIDLDRFKEVNDSFGHEPGDFLLREVARRLQKNFRPDDIVARLGGDEFVVAAACPTGRNAAAAIAEKLLSTLAAPVDIAGQEVFVGASIGISMFPEDGQTKERLFQSADTAMYRAKAAGRNGYRFFEAEMTVEAKTRMTLELSLRRAIERMEFELHYQPRIDLKTMAIVGMEALIRWNHPELGMVQPMQFIPIAEEKGLIEPIGRWVLEEACTQTRRLMGEFGRPLRVSVNLSARQLNCNDIVEQVQAVLRKSNLPPRLLELELTESALIDDIERSAVVLKELKSLGIQLSVDDFGTGYSGLAYLRRFTLDTLKLDRSFVTQQVGGISSFKFIKAFVDLAHSLNLAVVAEGVETGEALQFLRNAACDEAQGYFLARPLTLPAFEQYLSRLPSHGARLKGT